MIHPNRFIILAILSGVAFIILSAALLSKPFESVAASADTNASTESIFEVADLNESESNQTKVENQNCILPSSYPDSIQQWCQIIEEFSLKYEIDMNLIAAVVLQESGGQSDAYSASGAVGLMQIMPKDGIAENFQCINGPCFQNRPSMDELYNPEFNIEYGSKMLSNLYKNHGNWRDALKSYGPMDVGYYYADIILEIQNNYQ